MSRLPVVGLAVLAVVLGKRPQSRLTLPRRFLRMCRRNRRNPKVSDSTGAELTGADLLARAWILRRLLRRQVVSRDESYIGLLLPPSVASVVANAAVALDRRIAVNLNYTASAEVINACIRQSGIRHVLTSRRVMERLHVELHAETVYLEDFKDEATWWDRLVAAAVTWMIPVSWLERWLGLTNLGWDELLSLIFTSGTTGRPKGVMLTQRNIAANVDAMDEVIDIRGTDVLMGILPFFHSFGYTGTLWTILSTDARAVYHHNPLEARQIGQLSRQHSVTILVATPTFLRSYLKRCEPQDFAAVEVLFVGAERLPAELANAFHEKFGVWPLEGYGATELSPVAAGNIPAIRGPAAVRQGSKPGTVGRPLPGVEAKVIDLETGEDLGANRPGLLLIKGPGVMKGYLGMPDATAEVLRDGWYHTGDIALIDSEGFICITDRVSRFSKIGGEMVPHIRVEEAIQKVLGGNEDGPCLVITAVPDPRKGERLVVLHTGLLCSPAEICRQLGVLGLPPLWIPSPDSFLQVEEIPILGTGKLDLKRVKDLAAERLTCPKVPRSRG